MAISWVGIGATLSTTGDSGNVLPPAGILPGDFMLIAAACKYSSLSRSGGSAGWLNLSTYVGGVGAAGVDSGDVTLSWFVKVAVGGESSETYTLNKSITGQTGQILIAKCAVWRKSSPNDWEYADQGYEYEHTNGANWTGACAGKHNGGYHPGVMLIPVCAINGGAASFTASSLTHTGLTIPSPTFRTQNRSTGGHGVHLVIGESIISAGVSQNSGMVFNMSHATDGINYPAGITRILSLREAGEFRKKCVMID